MNPLRWLPRVSRFETRQQPLLSWHAFGLRLLGFLVAALIVDTVAIAIGAFGFRRLEHMRWLDALLNASMLITGNGATRVPQSAGGKLFQMLYALTGGIVFVAVVSVLLAPIFHRVMHAFSIDLPDEDEDTGNQSVSE